MSHVIQFSNPNQMHPEQIKAAIRMAGTTQARIADDLGVSHMAVSHVIHSRSESARVKHAIAATIGRSVDQIWAPRQTPLRRSRA
ncbi:MAG: helix-turn-helix domain-containing protein [Proteobacteria bacterium]|nr:helix-turn-helix domain-containing protein [Pseudomonadota bacterium]